MPVFIIHSNRSTPVVNTKKVVLKQQEQIVDEAKFVFRPVVEIAKQKAQLKVLFEITSYIYGDILNLNYKNNTMLEFGDTIIQPHDFIVIEKSNHKLIGQLIFKATDFNPSNQWRIKLFTFSDHDVL